MSAGSNAIDLSLILACYREEEHIEASVARIVDYLVASRLRFELIFVEDASPDGTAAVLGRIVAALAARGVEVQAAYHQTNLGRGASVQEGFQLARGNVVGFLDVDLENRLDVLVPMYERIARGECDGVVGKRSYVAWTKHPLRVALSLANRRIMSLALRLPIADPETGFKLFRRRLVLPVLPSLRDQRWFWDAEIVARCAEAGLRLADHDVAFERSATKQSTVHALRDSWRHAKALVGYICARPPTTVIERRRSTSWTALLSAWVGLHPVAAYVACTLFVVASAVLSVGWLQPDEHARVLEPAHKLAYGYATLPWEMSPGTTMVSYFLGALHAPLLMATGALGLTGLTEAAILRMFSGVICMTRIIAFYLLLDLLGLRRERRALYVCLYVLAPFTLVLLPRTTQENWATTGMLWALYLLLRAVRGEGGRAAALGGGFCLSFSLSSRFQMGLSCAALALWTATRLIRAGDRRALMALGVGAMSGLIPLALVDALTVGRPFLPAWTYLRYAITDEGGGNVWGAQPWWTYLEGFLTGWYPPLSVPILVLIGWGLTLRRELAAVLLPFLAVHHLISHKELRYLSPMAPVWCLATLVGYEAAERRWAGFAARLPWRAMRAYAAVWAVLGVVLALVPLNPQPFFYEELRLLHERGELSDPFTFVATSRSTVALFYYKHPESMPTTQIAVDEFVEKLGGTQPPRGDFAVQRVPLEDVPRIEAHCRTIYSSIPGWGRWTLEALKGIVKFRYVDEVVRC